MPESPPSSPPWKSWITGPAAVGWVSIALFTWIGAMGWGSLETLVFGWFLWNLVILLGLFFRALLDLGTVLTIRASIGRWAFWPALLMTFSLLVPSGRTLNVEQLSGVPVGPAYLLILVLVFPTLVLLGMLFGVAGAGAGLLLGKQGMDREAFARSGVRWLCLMGMGLLVVANFELRFLPRGWNPLSLLASLPCLMLIAGPWIGRGIRLALMGRLDLWLARRLRWRVMGRVFDLRAEAFATIGFGVAWGLLSLQILHPLQGSALLSEIQVFQSLGLRPTENPAKLVLLEWDSAHLRAATTRQSEAAIQAMMIRRLSELGALRIVLPVPAEQGNPAIDEEYELLLPETRESELNRSERDLALLEGAMREAKNVVLIEPAQQEQKQVAYERLKGAALAVGSGVLEPYRLPALPAVPFQWAEGKKMPVPLLLYAASQGEDQPSKPVVNSRGVADFVGKSFPLIDRERQVLVNLMGSRVGREFARVTYSELERGEWQFSPAKDDKGRWVRPEEYFRDRIVFLPPMRSAMVPGPMGLMESTELLAQATRTLSGSRFLKPMSEPGELIFAYGCALLIGRLAMRRIPLKAAWRLLMLGVVVVAVAFFGFGGDWWIDPVFPITSAVASFVLVTQLSFNLERASKERTRTLLNRFVDPSIVRELLDSQKSRLGLGGDRERVVILFADVRGFSRFAENHPPEEVMRVVNAYLGVMTEALHARGGLLDKYTGDGLMAMFRLERGQTIAGAVETALAMRDAALELSRGLKAEGERVLRVGISLHAGEAVVGLVGNAERQINFTALGHVVVVAARLQNLTGGGEVIVSRGIRDEVETEFLLEPRPEVLVKGISQPVQPYVVIGRNGDET